MKRGDWIFPFVFADGVVRDEHAPYAKETVELQEHIRPTAWAEIFNDPHPMQFAARRRVFYRHEVRRMFYAESQLSPQAGYNLLDKHEQQQARAARNIAHGLALVGAYAAGRKAGFHMLLNAASMRVVIA